MLKVIGHIMRRCNALQQHQQQQQKVLPAATVAAGLLLSCADKHHSFSYEFIYANDDDMSVYYNALNIRLSAIMLYIKPERVTLRDRSRELGRF